VGELVSNFVRGHRRVCRPPQTLILRAFAATQTLIEFFDHTEVFDLPGDASTGRDDGVGAYSVFASLRV